MKVIDYFETNNKEYWLSKISKCDWMGGIFLSDLLLKNELTKIYGKNTKLLLLVVL